MQWSCIIYSLSHIFLSVIYGEESFIGALGDALSDNPTSLVIVILSILVAGFVTHLFGYHLVVIIYQGMSTYESKKDHFTSYVMGNPYSMDQKRGYLFCRRKVTNFFDLREDEPLKVADSDRRCSVKIVTKDRDIRKMLKYSLIGKKEKENMSNTYRVNNTTVLTTDQSQSFNDLDSL